MEELKAIYEYEYQSVDKLPRSVGSSELLRRNRELAKAFNTTLERKRREGIEQLEADFMWKTAIS